MALFKKSISVGVSITPGLGLEAAQIDYQSGLVIKYGYKPLEYDVNTRSVDLDIFKNSLQGLLEELEIPKGSEIVLNLPPVTFTVNDYPASLDEVQLAGALEGELFENQLFGNSEPCMSAVRMPNSSVQFNKIACAAAHKDMLIETAMMIKDIGYKLTTIDVSVNSTLNALMYKGLVNAEPQTNWLLFIVEDYCLRVIPMQGKNYVDAFEEKVAIGSVLGDAENYAAVINAVAPLLKNLPSQYLYVISKTNLISAEILAGKLTYSSPIIHQEANIFLKEAFLEFNVTADKSLAGTMSPDVVGAAIRRDFSPLSNANFNLYNESLGDVWKSEQPLVLPIGRKKFILTPENLIITFIIIAVIVAAVTAAACIFLLSAVKVKENANAELTTKKQNIEKFLKQNESISSGLFDEGTEIRGGILRNKSIYSYYTIMGTEIPQKLWLTYLKLSDKVTIEGQADNLESIYSFYRNIKDFDPDSRIQLQKLGLAASSSSISEIAADIQNDADKDAMLTSLNADFYEFIISDDPNAGNRRNAGNKDSESKDNPLPDLEPIE